MMKGSIPVKHEVLAVYDMPEDTTIPIIKEMVGEYPGLRPVYNKLGRGVTNAITSGVRAAKGEYVLIITADDEGPLPAIGSMLDLMDKGYDLVSATRYAKGGTVHGGHFASRVLSRMANKILYLVGGFKFTDATVGIKMFKRSVFDKIKLESKPVGWVGMFEFSIKAQLAGFKIGEVPITSMNRFYGGKSTFNLNPWVREYTKWFLRGWWSLYRSGKRR